MQSFLKIHHIISYTIIFYHVFDDREVKSVFGLYLNGLHFIGHS